MAPRNVEHTCDGGMNPPFPGPCAACEREKDEYAREYLSPESRIRNRCQVACFTSSACRPGAPDACPMCRVADNYAALLAALKAVVAEWEGEDPSVNVINAARAAIAKAEGK